MPTFISDPPPFVYLLLGAVVVITGAIAAQRQNRKSAIPFFAALAVLLFVFALDRFLDSPREEAVKEAKAMEVAADAGKSDDFVKHVADSFVYHSENGPRAVKRDELKASPFWGMLKQYNVHVATWDFARDDVKVIDDDTVEIGFMAKGEARGQMQPVPFYIRTTFKRQSDGKMRLTEFRTFDPVNHTKPVTIPNFP